MKELEGEKKIEEEFREMNFTPGSSTQGFQTRGGTSLGSGSKARDEFEACIK